MDERVLRRLCGMLGVPAAGLLSPTRPRPRRAALLGGEPARHRRGRAAERSVAGSGGARLRGTERAR